MDKTTLLQNIIFILSKDSCFKQHSFKNKNENTKQQLNLFNKSKYTNWIAFIKKFDQNNLRNITYNKEKRYRL